jgi:hypothetical protein
MMYDEGFGRNYIPNVKRSIRTGTHPLTVLNSAKPCLFSAGAFIVEV